MSLPYATSALLLEGIAHMIHAYAFSSLSDDPETSAPMKALLKNFSPNGGGNWLATVPGIPTAAHKAAVEILARCGNEVIVWAECTTGDRRALRAIGHDIALTVLGSGAGLNDGDWADPPDLPHLDEAFSYYVGDDGTIHASTLVGDFACWVPDDLGGLALVPTPSPLREPLGDLFD